MTGIQMIDYDRAIKVQRDSYGRIISGLVVGDILHQNQAIILSIGKGDLKENPSVGVGAAEMLLDHDYNAIRNEIRQQLEMDGQKVAAVVVTDKGILIDAKY